MEMVSVTTLCGTLLTMCAAMNNVPTEEVVAQSTYDTVDSQQINEWMGEIAIQSPYIPRSVLKPEVVDYLVGYQEHVEEQERLRLEELERQRQEELERQRQAEEARQRELASYTHKGYRQTHY